MKPCTGLIGLSFFSSSLGTGGACSTLGLDGHGLDELRTNDGAYTRARALGKVSASDARCSPVIGVVLSVLGALNVLCCAIAVPKLPDPIAPKLIVLRVRWCAVGDDCARRNPIL